MEDLNNIFMSLVPQANMQLADPDLRQYYTDYANRIIWLDTEIDETARTITRLIMEWNREDHDIPTNERKPIKLLISSGGGSLDISNEIVAIIEMSKTPVYGYAMGLVASGASMIYLSCHKRFAMPNATYIFHKGSCQNVSGTFQEIMAFMVNWQQDIENMVDFYKKHTTYDSGYLEEQFSGSDWYIRAQEAVENGVADAVITDINDVI